MVDFPRQRPGPQSQALHFSYEKAGLVIDNQPIPWNADAVLVEAQASAPPGSQLREDYGLRLAGSGPMVPAESIRPGDRPDLCRIFFRLPTPARTTFAEVLWRGKSRGQLTLTVLQAGDFLRHLSLQTPTLSVQLGEGESEQTIQCQTAVTTQCRSVVLSAMLTSATSLAPIVDLGLSLRMFSEKGDEGRTFPIHLSSSQLRGRQALAAVVVPRPRRTGTWQFQWVISDNVLAGLQLQMVSKTALLRSLRISATRFLLQYPDGRLSPALVLPADLGEADKIERIGPCFWVTSSLPGVAGFCELQMRVKPAESGQESILHEQVCLISDGPTPIAMGTLDRASLQQVKHFELRCRGRTLGVLPLAPVPISTFDGEGAFKPGEEFTWSAAAEEQFQRKLGQLLGGR